ncbi:SsrA-binding protein SmpB [bacterium]|nr:SsrA-binding protein SmpB [bacterium]
MAKAQHPEREKLVCQNRKARHEYFIDDTIEAGVELKGTEVKSLRQGQGSVQESYAQIKGGEAWIFQFHIPPYEQANRFNQDPVRTRRLLMHRREIDKLGAATDHQGYTLVPLEVYFRKGRVKILIGIAHGKKSFDKRASIKERDITREMDRMRRGRG